jgi:hypothetical protein
VCGGGGASNANSAACFAEILEQLPFSLSMKPFDCSKGSISVRNTVVVCLVSSTARRIVLIVAFEVPASLCRSRLLGSDFMRNAPKINFATLAKLRCVSPLWEAARMQLSHLSKHQGARTEVECRQHTRTVPTQTIPPTRALTFPHCVHLTFSLK